MAYGVKEKIRLPKKKNNSIPFTFYLFVFNFTVGSYLILKVVPTGGRKYV